VQKKRKISPKKGKVAAIPLEQIFPTPRAELIELLEKEGLNYGEEFPNLLTNLLDNIKQTNPIELLSIIACFGLPQGINSEGNIVERTSQIEQFHVEIIQALTLHIKLHEYQNVKFSDPQIIQKIWDGVISTCQAFSGRRFKNINIGIDKKDKRRQLIVEAIRLHTQYVRNWGYLQKVVQFMTEILDPLEDKLEAAFGIPINVLFELQFRFIRSFEIHMTKHTEKMRNVFRKSTVRKIVETYFEEFPAIEDTPEKLLNYVRDHRLTRDSVRNLLFEHSCLNLNDKLSFTAEQFADKIINSEQISSLRKILQKLSLRFGDLASLGAENYFLNNPCWTQPIIQLDENLFFQPIVVLPLSFSFRIVEQIIKDDDTLRNSYFYRRSQFLEQKIKDLLQGRFPESQILRGSIWIDPENGKQYENDVLMVIDCFAIVIEAKSGTVHEPAKRGATLALERDIEKLIEESAMQSQRFVDYLKSITGEICFDTKNGSKNIVNLARVTTIARLNVILEDICSMQTLTKQLQDAGFLSESIAIPPTMTIADLEIILEILEDPAKILHYLIRRHEFEQNADYLADEIDLLCFYLRTGFNIGTKEFDGTTLFLTGMSSEIDGYYECLKHGIQKEKPRLDLTKWWQDILATLQERKSKGWLRISTKLLSVPYADQRKIEIKFKTVQRFVSRNPGKRTKMNMVVGKIGPPQRLEAFVFLAYKNEDHSSRYDIAINAAVELMKKDEIHEALMMGVNVDIPSYPYNFIAITK
jgi:hypothetical protein